MKRTMAMAWKEWREAQIFLFIGLGLFVAIPGIDTLEQLRSNSNTITFQSSPWVLLFTGTLAVFIGVGITCRDFHGHLEDFWKSRPWLIGRWLLIKYFVGLFVVITPPIIALIIEAKFNPRSASTPFSDVPAAARYGPYLGLEIYSVAFAFGCLIRRMANAAMLGLGAMLLIYFLPLILPPLSWLNPSQLLAAIVIPREALTPPASLWKRILEVAVSAIGIPVFAIIVSIIGVRRDWHIISGQKMMYSSIATVLLILMSSIAFQVGTNLPILQKVTLPTGENVIGFHMDGDHGAVLTGRFWRPLDVINNEIKLGPAKEAYQPGVFFQHVWPKENPVAMFDFDWQYSDLPDGTVSQSISLHEWPVTVEPLITPMRYAGTILPLWNRNFTRRNDDPRPFFPRMYIWQDRLYAFGPSTITVDISQPTQPRIISDSPIQYTWVSDYLFLLNRSQVIDQLQIPLPQLDGVPPRQRLEAAFTSNVNYHGGAWLDGDYVCVFSSFGLYGYQLRNLTDKTATFQDIGQYQPSFLEGMFGMTDYDPENVWLKDGLLYTSSRVTNDEYGRSQSRSPAIINPIITVFDLHGPQPLRKVGHFAAPGAGNVFPLSDGRALIGGGNDLYLVGPPPSRK